MKFNVLLISPTLALARGEREVPYFLTLTRSGEITLFGLFSAELTCCNKDVKV